MDVAGINPRSPDLQSTVHPTQLPRLTIYSWKNEIKHVYMYMYMDEHNVRVDEHKYK